MTRRKVQGEPHVAGRHPDGRLSFLLNDFSGLPADAEAGGTGHSPEPAVHRRNQRAGPMDLQYFVELFCGGLTRGSIYAHRVGLHDGVRDHRAHQLRSRRNLYDRRVHRAHRGECARHHGIPGGGHHRHRRPSCGDLVRGLRLHHREDRLSPPARRSPAFAPHLRHRRVDLPPELCEPGSDVRLRGLSAAHHRL